MRLKEDNSSWKSSGIRRRDSRNDKSIDGATGPAKTKKKKRSWCGGKEERRHELAYRRADARHYWAKYQEIHEIFCTRCSKVLAIDRFQTVQNSKAEKARGELILNVWRNKLGYTK